MPILRLCSSETPGCYKFFCLSSKNMFFAGKKTWILEVQLTSFWNFWSFFRFKLVFPKNYLFKSRIKNPSETTGLKMIAAEKVASYFWKVNVISLGKLIISTEFFFYFSRETTEVLSKVQFLKAFIWSRISITNPFNIKHIPPVLAAAPCFFYLDNRNLWELSLKSQLWQDSFRENTKI